MYIETLEINGKYDTMTRLHPTIKEEGEKENEW